MRNSTAPRVGCVMRMLDTMRPIRFLHRDGTHDRLREGGQRIGHLPGSDLRAWIRIELAPGDRLILFTDGVTEAYCSDDEEFGEARLLEASRRKPFYAGGCVAKIDSRGGRRIQSR